jgi:hypothetical protein
VTKPKIAVAMYGIPRGSEITMPSLMKHFIEPARRIGECRVFYHLFQQDRVINVRSGEDAPLPHDAYAPFADFNGELERPGPCLDLWQFDRIREFGDHYRDDFCSVRNLVHQLHSMRQVTAWLSPWRPDVVLYLRPDLLYHTGPDVSTIETLCEHPRRCIVPDWQWWGGYNDRFAFCGAEAYAAYGNRIERAIEFSERTGRPLQAERLLRYVLQNAGASVRTTAIRADRVRVDGRIKPEDFSAHATAGSIRRQLEIIRLHLLTRLSV